MIKKLYILKKERGIRPLTANREIKKIRSDMSSKEISLVCKVNIFLYYQRKIRIIGDRLIDPKE